MEVRVWVNQNGRNFGCASALPGTPCRVGWIYDDVHATFDIGHHRLAFADMDADGVDDVVVIARAGIFVGSVMQKSTAGAAAHAPRPGLLTRIHTHSGATTEVQYKTIQELDLEAEAASDPWTHHSRTPAAVVTQLQTQDTSAVEGSALAQPYRVYRTVRYSYRDPAYDRWTRSFVGFRKVREQIGSENAVTETTYWFSACQNDRLASSDASDNPEIRCNQTSDDELDKARSGRAVRIDRFVPALVGPQGNPTMFLWSKTIDLDVQSLFAPTSADPRRVSTAFATETRLHLFDHAQPTTPGAVAVPSSGGSDPIDGPPQQANAPFIHREYHYDVHGELTKLTDHGTASSSRPDTETITFVGEGEVPSPEVPTATLTCNEHWECNPTFIATYGRAVGGSAFALRRHTRLTYGYGPLADKVAIVEGWLSGAGSLMRQNPSGGGTAASPSVPNGWRTLASYNWDVDTGNVIKAMAGSADAPLSCTTYAYDGAYLQFAREAASFKQGCEGSALATRTVFNRGFGVPTAVFSPSGALTSITLDAFGRPAEIYAPEPDAPDPSFTMLAAAATFHDAAPAPYIDVRRVVGSGNEVRTVTAMNARRTGHLL